MRMLCVVCIVVGAPLLFPAAVGLIRRRRSALLVMLLSGLAGVSTLLCLGARGAVSPRCGSMPRRTALKTDVAVVRGVVSASIYMARLKVSALPLTARSAACKHTPPRDTLALCSAEPAWLTKKFSLSQSLAGCSQSVGQQHRLADACYTCQHRARRSAQRIVAQGAISSGVGEQRAP